MTASQAQYIANNFRVVEQQETTDSDFSATLFQRLDENGEPINEYYFAARGTDPGSWNDWLNNFVTSTRRFTTFTEQQGA